MEMAMEIEMERELTGPSRRWGKRIAVNIPVEVAAAGSPMIHARLKNLGLSGALVATDHILPLHAYIEIWIKTDEKGHNAVRVMARVARQLAELDGFNGLATVSH